ncbi:MAG: YggT family protein [Blastocatellia bacterium]|jgi:YggT family protein|nr:YggT family protein [Blastocatellia bacterium]
MLIIKSLFQFVTWGITALIVSAILLILLRSLLNYMEVNPFTWSAINLRRATEPVLSRVRAVLIGFRLDPKVAPFIAVIMIIVTGYMVILVFESLLNTAAGIVYALSARQIGAPVAIIGYLLFGLLGLYTLTIFIQIILSWLGFSYANRLMRFVFNITEPLLGPLRRSVPAIGMFDVSPVIAIIIIWVCKAAVAATLLRGWPVEFL